MSGGVLFGPSAWDPVAIVAQIVALQCMYYLSLGLLYKMIVAPYVPSMSLYHFFDWRWVSFSTFQGWMVCVAGFVNAVVAAVYLRLIVQRAKKCLDFAGTIFFWHLVAVACFSGFPKQLAWWIANGTNLAVTALLGEWMCMQRELQEIPLSSLRRNGAAAAGQASSSNSSGLGRPGGNARGTAAHVMELSSIVVEGGSSQR